MKKFVVLLVCSVIFISCDKSDDTNTPPDELSGNWELQRVSCFCFYPEDFDYTVHTINFNTSDGVLSIENSSETSFIAPAGSYNFQVQTDQITIDGNINYTYEITGTSLVLSFVDNPEIADDEISLFYSKI